MDLRFFKYEEFDSPDYPGSADLFMDRDFLRMLDTARSYSNGTPFKITSGYRTPEKNRAIYKNLGIPEVKSSHLYGRAADILATTSRDRFNIVNALIKAGFNRIGISEKSGFIHVDNDCQEYGGQKSSNVIWIY
jgi:uncharacterized protein YcbK (DUF882 family)